MSEIISHIEKRFSIKFWRMVGYHYCFYFDRNTYHVQAKDIRTFVLNYFNQDMTISLIYDHEKFLVRQGT
jgi:hypothetical protein